MALSNLSIASKKIIVTRLICFFWIVAKIISWKVWLAGRLFPIVPPFNFLYVPSFVHVALFIFSFVALITLFIFPTNKLLLVSVAAIEILSCLLDQNRWQPWEYQYIFIIIALLINYKNDMNALSIMAFIFAAIYFYSGLSKINVDFSKSIPHALSRTGIVHRSNSYLYNSLIYHIGYASGIIELSLGIGLLFQRTRKIAAILLIVMHVLILVAFGPLGLNYDVIIWPWNIVMILILYVLFISTSPVSIQFRSIKKGWNKLIILSFGILPALNFFGYWDFYLSSSLFSYRPPDMYICISKSGSSKELQPFFNINKNRFLCDSNRLIINVRTWSFQELMVPPYPELRVYKNIKLQILKRYPDMDATFIVLIHTNGQTKRIELK
ncbi:MAG: MauE/DoxX family redox-associated membrane protein [Ginsengibacter sp.]